MGPVIFFDGVCNLCNWSVDFVIMRDSKKVFRYASLQSTYAQQALEGKGVDFDSMRSLVLLKDDQVFTKSDAVLEVTRDLRTPWPLLYAFRFIPGFIRDGIYCLISKNRYRWFGRQSTCRVATPDEKALFIEEIDPLSELRS